jgi:uncharacterized protein (DUF2062 family)
MSWRQWQARLGVLLQLDDAPWRTALALAVGVFISFTPLWGVQTLLALLVATLARLNRGVTVTGTWLNLPWFAPFVYAGAVKLGALMLPDHPGWAGLPAWLAWLVVGSTALGLAAALLTWVVAFAVMRVRRQRRRHGGDADASRRAA